MYCNVKSSSFIKTEPQVADSAEITDLTVDEFVTKIFELSSNHLGETSVRLAEDDNLLKSAVKINLITDYRYQ